MIDSGAKDHITQSSKKNSSYNFFSSKNKVCIVDDSLTSISGKVSIQCTTLSLTIILHVPKFSSNLLSVSKIIKDLECKVSFYSTYCVFKELKTKIKVIGYDRVENSLYLLEVGFVSSENTSSNMDWWPFLQMLIKNYICGIVNWSIYLM